MSQAKELIGLPEQTVYRAFFISLRGRDRSARLSDANLVQRELGGS